MPGDGVPPIRIRTTWQANGLLGRKPSKPTFEGWQTDTDTRFPRARPKSTAQRQIHGIQTHLGKCQRFRGDLRPAKFSFGHIYPDFGDFSRDFSPKMRSLAHVLMGDSPQCAPEMRVGDRLPMRTLDLVHLSQGSVIPTLGSWGAIFLRRFHGNGVSIAPG